MNTPLLVTSVVLLAGVAARPIENERRGDDLRELAGSPDNDHRQAFLGRIPSGMESLNALQLHDLHDNAHPDDSARTGSASPKLTGADSPSDPDPGLTSPYMGPQRHLSGTVQELEPPTLTTHSPTPSSPAPGKSRQLRFSTEGSHHSPMVVILVFSSLAALVLLGMTVAVVYAWQLLERTVSQEHIWRSVVSVRRGGDGDLNSSEKEKVGLQEKKALQEGDMEGVIATREVPGECPSTVTTDTVKPSEILVEEPDVPSLPDKPAASSVPAVYTENRDRSVRLALAAWTYDNWVAHFMVALFGWLGVFFGGPRARG